MDFKLHTIKKNQCLKNKTVRTVEVVLLDSRYRSQLTSVHCY